MRRHFINAMNAAGLSALMLASAGCPDVASMEGTEAFPRGIHSLIPLDPMYYGVEDDSWHVASGVRTGEGPEQPIAFPHYRHVTDLNMQCEYCHTSARKSIHSGVPETQTCVNCHQSVRSVKDKPEIKKLLASYEAGEPLVWAKVHDLPDFVHFSHKRHVQGGLNCTECHGQVGLQGQTSTWTEEAEDGSAVEITGIKNVMVRESNMQMGWCLDCHASHPSIDKNYGDKAELRRAELKDCWTCHK